MRKATNILRSFIHIEGDYLARSIWITFLVMILTTMFSTAIAQTSVVILLGLWIISLLRGRPFRIRRTPLDLPVLAIIAARLLSILLAVNVENSLSAIHIELFFFALYFIATSVLYEFSLDGIRTVVKAILVAGFMASIVGIVMVLTGESLRARSVTSGYYTLGLYLTAAMGLASMMGDERRIFVRRWMWWACCGVIGIGILFTLNRMHWAMTGLALLIAGVWKERKLLAVSVLIAGGLILAVPGIQTRFLQILELQSHMSDRDVLLKGAWMIADQRPLFGFGPRSFQEVFPLHHELSDKGIGGWHNDFVQMYIESGILGLASFLWLATCVYVSGFKAWRKAAHNRDMRTMIIALLMSLSVFVVTGGFFDPLVSLLFKTLLAMLSVVVMKVFDHAAIADRTPTVKEDSV